MAPESSPKRRRLYNSRTEALRVLKGVNLSGRTFLVTGSSAGIGFETARSLALHGAHVVMANRNVNGSEKLKNNILAENVTSPYEHESLQADAKVDIIRLDLSSLKSVKEAAEEFLNKGWPLDVLVLNAGVYATAAKATTDGYESAFGVNHLGHFYFTQLLLPLLRESAKAGRRPRIVIVSSDSHAHSGISARDPVNKKLQELHPNPEDNENSYRLYSKSKLCNVLFAFKLHREENATNGISVYVLHPGNLIGTSIYRDMGVLGSILKTVTKPFTKTIQQGAATSAYCAAAEEVSKLSGKYWQSCWDDEKSLQKELARDEDLQDALWKFSENEISKIEEKHGEETSTHL